MDGVRQTWATGATLLAALGMVLFLPLLFGDPNSVDPHGLRLGAVISVMTIACWRYRRLLPARPVTLAIAGVVVPFVTWSAILQVLPWVFSRVSEGQRILVAGAIQLLLTLLIAWLIKRVDSRVKLCIRSFNTGAAVSSVIGVALLLLIAIAIPATLIGRLGIAIPAATAALGNGLIAGDVLQAASQELQFRGALMGVLEISLSRWQANIAQALLFAFGHLALEQYEGPIITLIPLTFGLGLLLGWITQRTRSIWPAIVIHVAAEVLVRVAVIPGLYGG